MVVVTREDGAVARSRRRTVDWFKVLVWIGAASLPWAAILLVARFVIAALG
jgi:hypothetical protein